MSIHAKAAELEYNQFPEGRTEDDSRWFGSSKLADELFPAFKVGREGKTSRDRESGASARRFSNRSARQDQSRGGPTGKKARG